ncbi:molybdopterin-binding protein [uncultured Maritimibacter sp.]|jgi:molybdenum cofactor synthesis domain-containing protein|uniref:competence/damage-inducible protein A n=1 Tax=uncultured Maritimibacter sp. TaxID=991866 RepID=UPI000A64DD64|nr:molybdopterin-binding protein [uncultured Maritimibacter sp.]
MTQSPNPTAAMLVIGDEILSGRTRDSNLHFLARTLTDHGVTLAEARVVSDDHDAIVAAVRALSDAHDHVFTSGGIGPTHDDITADAVAAAFDDHIDIRHDARDLLLAYFDSRGVEATEGRMRMARIPDRARLIDNPVSIAPGFTIRNVHVMAGVPSVFEAMVASVLPTIKGGPPLLSQSLRIEKPEGEIAGPLRGLAADFPDLSIGSYPFSTNGIFGSNIVIRGHDGARVSEAMVALCALFPGQPA